MYIWCYFFDVTSNHYFSEDYHSSETDSSWWPGCERVTQTSLRLPLFYALTFLQPLSLIHFGARYYGRWRTQHYSQLKAVLFPYTRILSKVFMTLPHTSHPRPQPLPANKLYSVLRHITTIRKIIILYVATFFVFRFILATCQHMYSTLFLYLGQTEFSWSTSMPIIFLYWRPGNTRDFR
jgi:hypothetical protein